MKSLIRRFPGVERFITSRVWQSYRHGVSLRTDPRVNSNFTGFIRLPTQFEVLVGPVVDYLLKDNPNRSLRIFSIGCSIGAEAYTVASYLSNRHPNLEFQIDCFDIDEKVIRTASEALFDPETEVFNKKTVTDEFVKSTFDIEDRGYRIRSDIRRHLNFHVANILDDDVVERFGRADLIFAQNLLFHLEPKAAEIAFGNICRLLGDRSAVYIDGTDIPIRQRLSVTYGLRPLEAKIEEIHNEARWARAVGYPYHYWGLEPFSAAKRDWKRRYATILLKD